MPDKSAQLTQDFLDDFAATEENLQHKWSSVRFSQNLRSKFTNLFYLLFNKPKNRTFVGPHRGGILSLKVEFLAKKDVFQWREAPILVGLQCINRRQKALVCDTENLRIVYETRENIFSFDIRLKLIGWEERHGNFSPIMGIFTFPVRLSQKYWVR